MSEGHAALTEKEKETLRLIVRGYDAKSLARELELSVHTVNERLRHARRKLEVSSSREAARLLASEENTDHKKLADKQLGEAAPTRMEDDDSVPDDPHPGESSTGRPIALFTGGTIMSLLAAFVAVSLLSGSPADPSADEAHVARTVAEGSQGEAAARDWLALVDASDWQASYDAAGRAFQKPNTVASWRAASELARTPLGDVTGREAIESEYLNAPPKGYQLIRFRTDFEHRKGAIESVTLEREDGAMKVVGYFIS